MVGSDLHPKDHNSQIFTNTSMLRFHLKQDSVKGLWSDGEKRLHINKCSRTEGGIPGPEKVQWPVLKLNLVGNYRQLNSGRLHKQTGRNPLGGDVCSLMENHDLVPSLQITLRARHILGCLNAIAKSLSRSDEIQSTKWSLHWQVFKYICQKWFTPHVDLFSTSITTNSHCRYLDSRINI